MALHECAPKRIPTRDAMRVFLIFVTSHEKINATFLAFPSVNFFLNLAQLYPHTISIKLYPIFVKICQS